MNIIKHVRFILTVGEMIPNKLKSSLSSSARGGYLNAWVKSCYKAYAMVEAEPDRYLSTSWNARESEPLWLSRTRSNDLVAWIK